MPVESRSPQESVEKAQKRQQYKRFASRTPTRFFTSDSFGRFALLSSREKFTMPTALFLRALLGLSYYAAHAAAADAARPLNLTGINRALMLGGHPARHDAEESIHPWAIFSFPVLL